MKKYLQVCTIVLIIGLVIYNYGFIARNNFNISKEYEIQQVARTSNNEIEIYQNGKWEKIFLKGVNIGAAKPGYFPGEFGITKEDYLRWLKQIKDMNCNVIRVYTLQMPAFYEAFYEFNRYGLEPLYLIHGVWVDEELMVEKQNAFNRDVIDTFKNEVARIIDVIHGNATVEKVLGRGYGTYKKDISPYVMGYILGIEWDPYFVRETNNINKGMSDFSGQWLYTENAAPIEVFFAEVGDHAIGYETTSYNMQKTIAITNWLTTDVIDHESDFEEANRIANIDTETIKAKESFRSGLFASYHVYPYYPDFLNYESEYTKCIDEDGNKNSYKAYLRDLMTYHSVPVVVSEFGVPSSRGITHVDLSRGFNQGLVSEKEQGEMNVEMLYDIYEEGYAGAIVFSWQDEWFKRTWNTMDMDVPNARAYWGDRMTNEEYFGLVSFDPGHGKSVVNIDGNTSEWKKKHLISEEDGVKLYMKSDESYVYFRINKENLDLSKEEILIPIDVTPNSGTTSIDGYSGEINKHADFIISIKGEENSQILVNDYYNQSDFLFNHKVYENNNVNKFSVVSQNVLGKSVVPTTGEVIESQYVDVGNLIYGNGNPKSKDYNSLADFSIKGDNIEIRIPWLMINVSDPSDKVVIDDFNKLNDINHLKISGINVGAYVIEDKIIKYGAPMKSFGWATWDMPTYHERLKQSYYIMKDAFKEIQ